MSSRIKDNEIWAKMYEEIWHYRPLPKLEIRQDSTCPQNRVISTSQHSQSLFEKLETCIFTK